LDLADKLALVTVNHVRDNLTKEQQESLARAEREPPAKAARPSLDKYKKFLAAEGVTAPPTDPAPAEPQAQHAEAAHSAVPWSALSLARVALAEEGGANTEAVAKQLLEEYRRAHEEGNLDRLAALYVSFPESQRKALSDYMKDVTHLHVELLDVKI